MIPTQLTEYHVAILGFLAENKYNKRQTDEIFQEFESDILDYEQIKSLLEDLEQIGYIQPVKIGPKIILNEEMSYREGYRVTQLGKNVIRVKSSNVTLYSNINNSNIAHESSHITQSIRISEQPEEIQKKFAELQEAIVKKDSSAMKKAFGYIADKSIDVAVAIMTGAILE